ncbi:MAG: monovalent cation/H(+) antiporter subunit G, partial [Alphaproteobacteria bacterium]|nr:monovalent cation/H(+) antiporter subunit G [Alphaproteobacteria bacterium]
RIHAAAVGDTLGIGSIMIAVAILTGTISAALKLAAILIRKHPYPVGSEIFPASGQVQSDHIVDLIKHALRAYPLFLYDEAAGCWG